MVTSFNVAKMLQRFRIEDSAKPKLENGESCEAISFNPWNGLIEQRPLGGISRARKAVYREISRLRHGFNKQIRVGPTAI
jgi:hypothetical protein